MLILDDNDKDKDKKNNDENITEDFSLDFSQNQSLDDAKKEDKEKSNSSFQFKPISNINDQPPIKDSETKVDPNEFSLDNKNDDNFLDDKDLDFMNIKEPDLATKASNNNIMDDFSFDSDNDKKEQFKSNKKPITIEDLDASNNNFSNNRNSNNNVVSADEVDFGDDIAQNESKKRIFKSKNKLGSKKDKDDNTLEVTKETIVLKDKNSDDTDDDTIYLTNNETLDKRTNIAISSNATYESIGSRIRNIVNLRKTYLYIALVSAAFIFFYEFIITVIGLTIAGSAGLIFIIPIIYMIHKIIVFSATSLDMSKSYKSMTQLSSKARAESGFFKAQINSIYRKLVISKNTLLFQGVASFIYLFGYLLFMAYILIGHSGINANFVNAFLGAGNADLANEAIKNGILMVIDANIVLITIVIVFNIVFGAIFWYKFNSAKKYLNDRYKALTLNKVQYLVFDLNSRFINMIYITSPLIAIAGPVLVFYFILKPIFKKTIISNWI